MNEYHLRKVAEHVAKFAVKFSNNPSWTQQVNNLIGDVYQRTQQVKYLRQPKKDLKGFFQDSYTFLAQYDKKSASYLTELSKTDGSVPSVVGLLHRHLDVPLHQLVDLLINHLDDDKHLNPDVNTSVKTALVQVKEQLPAAGSVDLVPLYEAWMAARQHVLDVKAKKTLFGHQAKTKTAEEAASKAREALAKALTEYKHALVTRMVAALDLTWAPPGSRPDETNLRAGALRRSKMSKRSRRRSKAPRRTSAAPRSAKRSRR